MTPRPPSPPRLALRLLRRIVERDDDFGAAGDIEEHYLYQCLERGRRRAALDSWLQVLAALPGHLRNQIHWSLQMLKSYIKIAFRNLARHKGYSFINIAGLALGMACSLFILLWVQDELSYDRFHAGAKALYRVEHDQKTDRGKFHAPITPNLLSPALQAEIPEVADSTRVRQMGALLFRSGDKAFYENRISAVDPSFLRMFSFPLLHGASETALNGPADLVVTEKFARKYFGTADAVGRSMTVNNAFPAMVTAVLKDVPDNSSLRFDALLPYSFPLSLDLDNRNWANNTVATFVRLHDKSVASVVNAKMTRLVRDRTMAQWRSDNEEAWKKVQADPEQLKQFNGYVGPEFMVNPLVDIRFRGDWGYNGTSQLLKTITTFAVIGLLVLLIACINFMNLSTARSVRRAREVGLRKVVGAQRRSIAGQFYGESVLTAVLAGLAALVLVVCLLPAFNAVAGKTMTLASLASLKFVLGILAVTALTGAVAGSYPALVLSSFQPIKVIKSRASDGIRGAGLRRALVVVQFGLSVLLLIGMAVAARQIDFMRHKNLGYDKDQLLYLPMRGEATKNYARLKERLLQEPKIQGVTGSNAAPTMIGSKSFGATWDGQNPSQRDLISCAFVDYDYTETMKIELAAGRTFSRQFRSDETSAFLVNEALAKIMGLDAAAAVGKRFAFMGVDGTIVGVVKDFHFQSVQTQIEPLAVAMGLRSPAGPWTVPSFAIIRLKAGDVAASLAAVEAAWREVNADYPFEYRFFDQDFDRMFRADERTGTILKIFAFLAVAIAGLGLFGLASFTAEQKTREIGVRKVLGASAPGLVVLLSKEFAKWVLVANALAWPAAYFLVRGWLQQFAYRTNIAWWLFPAAGAGALLIAMITVSFQAVRAARTNPVDALKYE
jgi:putative ABC transport system permease protein